MFVSAVISVTCLSVGVLSVRSCQRDGDLLPDVDCSRFLKCHNGIPTSLSCPAGLRFNSEISACDWPELVPCGQDHIRVSGAKMVWQKKTSTTTTTTTTETPRTIVDFISSRDKEIHSDLEELTLEEELKVLQSKSQIKESRNKIENVDEVLARVKGRLLPNLYLDGEMIRLNKQIPAKAVVVQTFKPRPGLRVMTAVRESYLPRGSVLV